MIDRIKKDIEKDFKKGNITIYDIIDIISFLGSLINLKTIPQKAKELGIKYVNARKNTLTRKITNLFGVKFVINK